MTEFMARLGIFNTRTIQYETNLIKKSIYRIRTWSSVFNGKKRKSSFLAEVKFPKNENIGDRSLQWPSVYLLLQGRHSRRRSGKQKETKIHLFIFVRQIGVDRCCDLGMCGWCWCIRSHVYENREHILLISPSECWLMPQNVALSKIGDYNASERLNVCVCVSVYLYKKWFHLICFAFFCLNLIWFAGRRQYFCVFFICSDFIRMWPWNWFSFFFEEKFIPKILIINTGWFRD